VQVVALFAIFLFITNHSKPMQSATFTAVKFYFITIITHLILWLLPEKKERGASY
jgi:hypothetical protein